MKLTLQYFRTKPIQLCWTKSKNAQIDVVEWS